MNIEEYLKLAQHLDKIGAYTAADITEKNMVKTAADEPQRDKALQGQEPASGGFFGGLLRARDRASISLTKFKNREEFIDESFKALNSYLGYAASVGFTDFANKLLEAKKELLVVAKQSLGRGSASYTPPTAVLPDIVRQLARASNVEAQGNFLDWSQSQAQIYVGNNRYYNYIYYLREAEVEITKKANPNFIPGGIANTPTSITARRPRGGAPPPPPAAAAAAAIGSAGIYPGGTSSSSGRTPPTRSIRPGTATNEDLARIVFTKLRNMDPTKEDIDIHKSLTPEEKLSGYNFIGSDQRKIAEIKAAIDATRYSPAKKQKMKKLLDQKIEDARNMAIESATNPAISEPTSTVQPTSSTSNTPPLSEYPSERTGDLRELNTLISDMERKASSTDKTLFVNSYNADARLVHETFDRLRSNMNPSTISRYEHRLSRLELVFVREVNK